MAGIERRCAFSAGRSLLMAIVVVMVVEILHSIYSSNSNCSMQAINSNSMQRTNDNTRSNLESELAVNLVTQLQMDYGSLPPAVRKGGCPAGVDLTTLAMSRTSPMNAGLEDRKNYGMGVCSGTLGMEGWMNPENAYFIAKVSCLQHQLGIFGSIGEIGVHHGLFFIALAHTALEGEPLFACDVFEQQNLNPDGSGLGDKAKFNKNLRIHGIDPESVHIYASSSLSLTPQYFQQQHLPRFRLFSVDGAHTVNFTFSDLHVAACSLVQGGIVALDDWNNLEWLGVNEGGHLFLHFAELHGIDLVPFYYGFNKLFLTTRSHHQRYLDFVMADRNLKARVFPYERSNLAGWEIAIGYRQESLQPMSDDWMQHLQDPACSDVHAKAQAKRDKQAQKEERRQKKSQQRDMHE
ncbi:Cephalosporin hydroxylase [Balamuthia mandrillaris]